MIPLVTSLLIVAAAQAQAPAAKATQTPAQAGASAQVAPSLPGQVPVDSALDARTSEVASSLRCPVCQGLSIQDSPSELAQQMRSLVHDQLAAGKSEAEVRSYFISKYGEWILLSPRPRGFNLLVYLLPAGLLFGGVGAIALVVRRWTSGGAGAADAVDAPDAMPGD